MDKYIPPSQLPINQKMSREDNRLAKERTKNEAVEIKRRRSEAQHKLPILIARLFREKPELVSIVDLAHPSARMKNKPGGFFKDIFGSVLEPKETLIYISGGYYAYENTIRAIPLQGVHNYRRYTRGQASFREFSGIPAGYQTITSGLLITPDSYIQCPGDYGKFSQSTPAPQLMEDSARGCFVASGFNVIEHVSHYEHAHILAAAVLDLLNSQQT